MEIYFDNSATTAPYPEVCQAVADTMSRYYGNPSSLHRMGKAAEDLMTDCRRRVAESIGASGEEIIFTSGGTESDNAAIIGYCMANKRRGNRIITTKIEHPAVLEPFKQLEKQGFEAVYLDVDENGAVSLSQLSEVLNEDTLLVSVMHVNNETGAIQPVEEIAAKVHASGAVFHIDAVQSYGKIKIDVKRLGADLLTISAHKAHGPKGIGALYIKKGVRIAPIIHGGGQEKGLRSSTENLPAIAGFAKAADIMVASFDNSIASMAAVKAHLSCRLRQCVENITFNTPEDSVCSVLNVSFAGVRSEVLLHVLEDKGIYVSSGSACSSHKKGRSHVLTAMGKRDNITDSALRFSFSGENTVDEAERVAEVLAEQVPILRKIMR